MMPARILAIAITLLFLLFSSHSFSDTYPQIDVSGYKQYDYTQLKVSPIENLFAAQAILGGYYAGTPLQEKLKLNITGKLTEKLSVSYDLEQQPDTPDTFNVKVTYDKTNLTFGDFQANFAGNEFVSTSKNLNGVMVTSNDNWYDLTFVPSAKLKSETQGLVTQNGNNTMGPYSLGHGSIIEGSETIQLNNVTLTRGADYTMDYFGGKIMFKRTLTTVDQFSYSYEFTNMVDLFFPTVSKKDFVGLQADIKVDPSLLGVPSRKVERSIKKETEFFPTELEMPQPASTKEGTSSLEATGASTPEMQESEWESTGTYKLANYPVIPYSETLTYMGTKLKKFEDYLINYTDGTITLLLPNLPTSSDPLSVEYDYMDVAQESETLPGVGKGPYTLAHPGLIEGSESVFVNNIPYVRELDYKIDYKAGKLSFFTNIPQTANVVIKYRYLVMAAPPAPPAPVTPRSLNLGVTYLKESGQSANTAPSVSATDSFSGDQMSAIINRGKVIYLVNNPVTSTGEVQLTKNGVTMTYGVDYVFPVYDPALKKITPQVTEQNICDPQDISDGLATGTIVYLGTLEGNDQISVNYNYSKWSQDRTNFSCSNKGVPNYLVGYQGVVAGAEQVQATTTWQGNTYTVLLNRRSSTEATNGDYTINYSSYPAYITLINDNIYLSAANASIPLSQFTFSVKVIFVAQASGSNQEIDHDVIGLNSSFSVGDFLSLNGSFARSKTDQVYTTVITSESMNGNGSNKVFTLNAPGLIIDGSEQVYMNNIKLNRDDQYYINYDVNANGKYGAITFPQQHAPATSDAITVDYSYEDTSGGGSTSVNLKEGNAYALSGSLKPNPNMEFAADYKKIDAAYSPMGGTSIPIGSDYIHGYSKITPLPSLWSSFWMSGDYKETNTPLGNENALFLHSYDRNLATGFNTFGLAQISFGYRDYNTLDDVEQGVLHSNDADSQSYSASIAPAMIGFGDFDFTNREDGTYSKARTDTVDMLMPETTIVDYFHTNNAFDLTKRVRWVVDYQVNQSNTTSYEVGGKGRGTVEANVETDDLSSNLNWDLTFGGIKRLYTYWNKIGHNQYDLLAGTTLSTVNETYHVDCVPVDQLTTSIDHNRQETPSIFTVLGNPKTETDSANVRYTPYSSTALAWSGSRNDSIQEGGTKASGTSNSYTITHTPISTSFYKLDTSYGLSASLTTSPSGTEEVTTDTRDFTQNYTLTLTPIPTWTLTSGYGQDDYTNNNNSILTPVQTNSQAQTITVGTAYKATTDLNLSANYAVKVTKVPDLSAHKANIDAHAVYTVFTYGSLNYDWTQEENGGEIIGGVFVDQNFSKVVQSVSFNLVLPQNQQMILTSIVLKAAFKWSDYLDRNNSDNNFKASLLTFEGTLNF
jgi:hypothetical protein